jgi:hypothetical protein
MVSSTQWPSELNNSSSNLSKGRIGFVVLIPILFNPFMSQKHIEKCYECVPFELNQL